MTRIFDSQAPMARRGRYIDVTDVDVTLDSNGDGNATASFGNEATTWSPTFYTCEVNGTTPAVTSVDRANEDGTSVPVYVSGGPASTTVTVTVRREGKDEGL